METSKNMFQKFKRNVLGVGQGAKDKTIDTRFETAKVNWGKLHQITNDLRTFATNYLTNAKGLFSNGGLVADTFDVIFKGQTHPYTRVSADHKTTMDSLNKEKARELELRFEAGAGAKLNELVAKFALYKTRLDEREELRSKHDYYNVKVTKLRKERDERLAKGTKETPKDIGKREENEKKLEAARVKFEQENAALSNELIHLWEHRLDLFGPVMVEFLLIQSTVSRLLAESARVSDASISSVGNAKLMSWESLMNYSETKSAVGGGAHDHHADSDSDDDAPPSRSAAPAPVKTTPPVASYGSSAAPSYGSSAAPSYGSSTASAPSYATPTPAAPSYSSAPSAPPAPSYPSSASSASSTSPPAAVPTVIPAGGVASAVRRLSTGGQVVPPATGPYAKQAPPPPPATAARPVVPSAVAKTAPALPAAGRPPALPPAPTTTSTQPPLPAPPAANTSVAYVTPLPSAPAADSSAGVAGASAPIGAAANPFDWGAEF